MMKTFRLPTQSIQVAGAVGPCFGLTISSTTATRESFSVNPFFLQISTADPSTAVIYYEARIQRDKHPKGFIVLLSYDFFSRTTNGFYKGSHGRGVGTCINHFQACASQIEHPMLLPIIVLTEKIMREEEKQRGARNTINDIERSLQSTSPPSKHLTKKTASS